MTLMNGPLFEAIGMALLHLLWQGAVVAVLLAGALRLLARSAAGARYAASCAALAALLVLGVATTWRSYEPAPGVTTIVPSAVAAEETAPAAVPVAAGDIFLATLRLHSSTIAVLWMTGVLIVAGRLAIGWSRTRELARLDTRQAPAEWQRVVDRLSETLGVTRLVRLMESAAVDVPSVIGFLRPVVLVPASSLSGLSPRQLEMILAHELAHIRRHDYLVNMLQSIAETLLFFHPAAWWISRQIRIERENCCDDLAVAAFGSPIEYARALTVLEGLRSAPSLAVAADGGSLSDRVRRLMARRDRSVINGWTALGAAVSFAVVMLATSLPLRADRQAAPPQPPPASEIDVVAPVEPPEPPVPVDPLPPDFDVDFDFDFDFELPDVDVDLPEIPAPRAIPAAPAVSVAPTPPPRVRTRVNAVPAIAPAPMAYAAADFDLDLDIADQGSDRPIGTSDRLTVDELIALRIHGVTPETINEMRALFGTVTVRQITTLRSMGVTGQYVRDLRAAGVEVKTPREAVSLRIANVTPEFVRTLAAAGYTKLTVRDLSRLGMAGVTGDFIKEMSKYRDKK